MVQDEIQWVLETVKTNWPEPSFPANIARIHRTEPKILETGQRTKSLELEDWNALGAGPTDRMTEPVGTEYDHRVETTVSCRLEALHADEWGQVVSSAAFEQLVRYTQHAINVERSYPTVDDVDGDDIGSVDYHTVHVENEQDLSDDNGDYFRRDWDVRLVGYSSLP